MLHLPKISSKTFLTKSKESQLSCGAPATDLKGRGLGVCGPNTTSGWLHGAHEAQHWRLPAS